MKKLIFILCLCGMLLPVAHAQINGIITTECGIESGDSAMPNIRITPYENFAEWKKRIEVKSPNIFDDIPTHDPSNDLAMMRVYKKNSITNPDHVNTVVEEFMCNTKYEAIYTDDLPPNINRPIYFVHGLGGTQEAWKSSYDRHVNEYLYKPYKIDYYGNQTDFNNASGVAHTALNMSLSDFFENPNTGIGFQLYDLPYGIGHSQGGLVLRDLDMKYTDSTIYRPLFNQRTFFGIITFGTPHAGAYIGVRQQEVTDLATEFSSALTQAKITEIINSIKLKKPFSIFEYSAKKKLLENFTPLVKVISDAAVPNILKILSADKTDLITQQYAPDAPYLIDTLNSFETTCKENALFYGVEKDPVLWHTAYHMLNPAEDFPPFGANQDGILAENMAHAASEMRAHLAATIAERDRNKAKYAKCQRNCLFAGIIPLANVGCILIFCDRIEKKVAVKNITITHLNNALEQFDKINARYKAILGAVEYIQLDTIGWEHRTYETHHLYRTDEVTGIRTIVHSFQRPKWTKYTQHDPSLAFADPSNYRPILRKTLHEIPSDGTVTVPSQMAFPYVQKEHKNELLDYDNNSGQNHLQMRNSIATEKALRMIFEANDEYVPEFYRLLRH